MKCKKVLEKCKNKGCLSLNGIEAVSWFVVKYYYLRCTRTACSGCHAIPLSSLFDFLGSMSLLAPTTTNACLLATLSSTHRRCGVWQLYSALVARFRCYYINAIIGITGQNWPVLLVTWSNWEKKSYNKWDFPEKPRFFLQLKVSLLWGFVLSNLSKPCYIPMPLFFRRS